MKPAGRNERTSILEAPISALEDLMNEYGTAVLRTAYFYLGDRHLAEDISQEVFLRAYRHGAGFRGDSSVKTWLTKITINACRDKLSLKSSGEQPTDPLLLQQNVQSGPEDQVLKQFARTTILKHVASLPPQYHEVIYLYYYMELSTVEIAEATQVAEGTVRGRLHRARELLRPMLEEGGGTEV